MFTLVYEERSGFSPPILKTPELSLSIAGVAPPLRPGSIWKDSITFSRHKVLIREPAPIKRGKDKDQPVYCHPEPDCLRPVLNPQTDEQVRQEKDRAEWRVKIDGALHGRELEGYIVALRTSNKYLGYDRERKIGYPYLVDSRRGVIYFTTGFLDSIDVTISAHRDLLELFVERAQKELRLKRQLVDGVAAYATVKEELRRHELEGKVQFDALFDKYSDAGNSEKYPLKGFLEQLGEDDEKFRRNDLPAEAEELERALVEIGHDIEMTILGDASWNNEVTLLNKYREVLNELIAKLEFMGQSERAFRLYLEQIPIINRGQAIEFGGMYPYQLQRGKARIFFGAGMPEEGAAAIEALADRPFDVDRACDDGVGYPRRLLDIATDEEHSGNTVRTPMNLNSCISATRREMGQVRRSIVPLLLDQIDFPLPGIQPEQARLALERVVAAIALFERRIQFRKDFLLPLRLESFDEAKLVAGDRNYGLRAIREGTRVHVFIFEACHAQEFRESPREAALNHPCITVTADYAGFDIAVTTKVEQPLAGQQTLLFALETKIGGVAKHHSGTYLQRATLKSAA